MNIWFCGICAIILISLYYRWFFGYWKSKNVKTLSPNLLFGNMADVLLRKVPPFKMFEKAYQTSISNGYKYIGYYLLGKPVLLVTDLDLIRRILITDFPTFSDREFYLHKENDPLSVHIGSMRGADWKHMRGLLSPAFTPSKLKLLYPTLTLVGEQLKSVLDEAQTTPVNIKELAGKFIFDSVGMCIFGLEINSLKNQNLQFQNYARIIGGDSVTQKIKVFLSFINPAILYFFRIPFNSRDVQEFFINLTKNTVEQREKDNIVRKDMMHLLIQIRNNINIEDNPDGIVRSECTEIKSGVKSLTIEEIAAQTLVFFGGGFETTTSVLTSCLYELLLNKSVMDKALLEINSVVKKYGKITYEALSEMTYLENVINETVRMYPPIPILSRVSTKNYKIPDSELIVEKGTTIFIPVYEISYDGNYFKDPEKFVPERLTTIGSELKSHHKCNWLGFGEGPRKCIGERFGFLMAKTFLSTVLYHYNISFNPSTKLPLQMNRSNMVLSFKDELLVDFRRNNI